MTSAVIIATYNGEKYIKEQLESKLQQTRKVDKIFIFDDCSTDKTFEICSCIAKENDNLISVQKNEKNLGYRKNFEQALQAAQNYDLIFFSDQDDWWFPNKIEVVATEFEKSEKLVLFFSNAYIADENLKIDEEKTLFSLTFHNEKKEKFNKNPQSVLCMGKTVTGCTMAIRNSIIKSVLPFSAVWIHDEWIAAIASLVGDVKYTDEKLIKYRQNPNQLIGAKEKKCIRHSGLNKFRYAMSEEAAKEEIEFLDERLPLYKELNNFLSSSLNLKSDYLNMEISFKSALKKNYHSNLFSRLMFFVFNTVNGKYRKMGIPFSHSVRDIFIHTRKA